MNAEGRHELRPHLVKAYELAHALGLKQFEVASGLNDFNDALDGIDIATSLSRLQAKIIVSDVLGFEER